MSDDVLVRCQSLSCLKEWLAHVLSASILIVVSSYRFPVIQISTSIVADVMLISIVIWP